MSQELKFANTNEALQHLSDITGKRIKIAWNLEGRTEEEMFEEYEQEAKSSEDYIKVEIDSDMPIDDIEDFVKRNLDDIGYDNRRNRYPVFVLDGIEIESEKGSVEEIMEEDKGIL